MRHGGTRTTDSPQHRGDATGDSFVVFYRREYPQMVRLAFLLTLSAELAEDAVQDSFERVHRRFGRLDNPGGYLRSTVVNRCHELARRKWIERRHAPGAAPGEPPTTAAFAELRDVLLALPDRQRAVVVLRYWADWTEADIAAAVGCAPGTVKSLASRALAALREELT